MKQIFILFSIIFLPSAIFLPLEGSAGTIPSKTDVTILSPAAGSCNNTSGGFCNEFTGASYKIERVKKSCKEGRGIFYLAGACPTEKLVGKCVVYKGKNTESNYSYYTNFPGYGVKPAGGVAVAAKNQCNKLKGEWIPN